MTAAGCRGLRLDLCILGEGRAGLVRLWQAQRSRADGHDAVWSQQRLDLPHLALIVGGDHQLTTARQLHARTSFCRMTSSPMPLRASLSSATSSSSLKGAPSAVP